MKKIKIIINSIILFTIFIISGCKNEMPYNNKNEENVNIELKSNGELLEISYEITSFQQYKYNYKELTELDLAHINPSEEKQRIVMFLMPDGSVNMTIEELDFERTIKIPHKIQPDNNSKITKTEIVGGIACFYDKTGKMTDRQPVEIPNQKGLAEQIKKLRNDFGTDEVAKAFNTMRGMIFDQAIDQMLADAKTRGKVTEYDEQFVTVRTKFSDYMPDAKGAAVILVDRNINKIVSSVIYDEKENETSRNYFGYEKNGAPILNATRTEQLIELPSGAKVWQITDTKIDKMKYNLKN